MMLFATSNDLIVVEIKTVFIIYILFLQGNYHGKSNDIISAKRTYDTEIYITMY